ncbi:MAG: pantetheine-phosphate adenylyltransferase [bacterium]|nr:pantetheine-phosphate adenylyltransferase [bacterium]
MTIAVYPGSFDPVTLGHLDIIERASKVVDHLIIGVLNNNSKTPLFSVEERVKMLKDVTAHFPNVEVQSFGGLLIEFAHRCNATVIIRGLRAITDFEYELQLAHSNRMLAPDVDTMFFTTNLRYAYVSSSMVKEVATFGGDFTKFVPEQITASMLEKYKDVRKQYLPTDKDSV